MEHILKDRNVGAIERKGPETVRAGNVMHLQTKYAFKMSAGAGPMKDLIMQLHPTPAVCGLPKEKALRGILSTEKHNREYYAGFCGPLNHGGTTDLFVNLRCMKIFPDKLALYTGGGLTADSDPEKEWEETEMTAATLLSMI
jgi:isochorismate synthase